MKFTFNVSLDGAHKEKLVLGAWKGEMTWHVALKLLGYLLYFEDHPRIEEGVDWHYKPDLVAQDADGKIRLWIDCGNIAVRKIDRVATKIGAERFVILRRTAHDAKRLDDAMRGKVKRRERVQLIAFEDSFVDALADHLDRTNDLIVRRSAESLSVVIENRRGRYERTTAILRS